MRLVIFFIALFSVVACSSPSESFILLSKDSSNRISNWLKKEDSSIVTREFYTLPIDSMDYFLERAKAIVIGGGEDVHPSVYGKEEYVEVCGAFDEFRDSIEMVLIKHALLNKKPLLGICRGHQIINAVNGGTLIPDIPSFSQTTINHRSDRDSAHVIICMKDSWLSALNIDTLWVNSRHHQCIDELSPLFSPAAYSPDGIIESIQIADTLLHPFAVGVQWHPEGLHDKASAQIAKLFLNKINRE